MFKSGGHVRDIGFVIIYVQAQYNLIARKTTGGFFQDKEASVWHLSLSLSHSIRHSVSSVSMTRQDLLLWQNPGPPDILHFVEKPATKNVNGCRHNGNGMKA